MGKFQKICVTAFIPDDKKILILKRSEKEDFLPEYWEMPGGKVEFAESPDKAVAREVKEETNLEIKAVSPYSLFSYVSGNGERHTVDIQYIAKIIGDRNSLKISDAHSGYKWISEEEIEDYKFSDSMIKSIKRGFQSIKS
jgi:8-oxo-dGTP diphosphatase